MKLLSTIVLASAVSVSSAFVSSTRSSATSSTLPSQNNDKQSNLLTLRRMAKDDGKDAGSGPFGGFNPFKEIGDMFQNLDDVIDDFYNKRMGKGEIFYGKRKYKPSGTVEGDYNGLGLTDKQRIDDAREYKRQWEEERAMRREMAELRRAKEERDRTRYQ